MIPGVRLRLSHGAKVALSVQQVLGHENHQNGIHPVITEALGGFVSDNERHARRHFVGLEWRSQVRGIGHRLRGLSQIEASQTSAKAAEGRGWVHINFLNG